MTEATHGGKQPQNSHRGNSVPPHWGGVGIGQHSYFYSTRQTAVGEEEVGGGGGWVGGSDLKGWGVGRGHGFRVAPITVAQSPLQLP